MSREPYDYEADYAFDAIIGNMRYHESQTTYPLEEITMDQPRHPGGRTMTRDTKTKTPATAEDKRAQAWQMLGCSSLILAVALAVAVITLAWRL